MFLRHSVHSVRSDSLSEFLVLLFKPLWHIPPTLSTHEHTSTLADFGIAGTRRQRAKRRISDYRYLGRCWQVCEFDGIVGLRSRDDELCD